MMTAIKQEPQGAQLRCPLPGISSSAWTKFVKCMMTGKLTSVSDSNALGMFELMPRRLNDLGLLSKLGRSKSKNGRTIWVGEFIPPLTSKKFLKSPFIQYRTFAKSMKDYFDKLKSGEIDRHGESVSGALAILHRTGPKGLVAWKQGNRFSDTEKLYANATGLF